MGSKSFDGSDTDYMKKKGTDAVLKFRTTLTLEEVHAIISKLDVSNSQIGITFMCSGEQDSDEQEERFKGSVEKGR